MNNDKLRIILEELGVDENKVGEFLKVYEENLTEKEKNIPVAGDISPFTAKKMIDDEPDWRKKAQLSARLISADLEI